jgi:hypothetical protein
MPRVLPTGLEPNSTTKLLPVLSILLELSSNSVQSQKYVIVLLLARCPLKTKASAKVSELYRKVHLLLILFIGLSIDMSGTPQSQGRIPSSAEAITVVISPQGFAQTTLSLQTGSYVFMVVNRTGLDDIRVHLERASGESGTANSSQEQFAVVVTTTRARFARNAKLTPGMYRLRVDNRPAWVCTIHVN